MKKHKSLISNDWESCYICGGRAEACHHIFFGPNRSISEREGFTVALCNRCHNMGRDAVHFNRRRDLWLKRLAQERWESRGHSREEFIKLIGRSYL